MPAPPCTHLVPSQPLVWCVCLSVSRSLGTQGQARLLSEEAVSPSAGAAGVHSYQPRCRWGACASCLSCRHGTGHSLGPQDAWARLVHSAELWLCVSTAVSLQMGSAAAPGQVAGALGLGGGGAPSSGAAHVGLPQVAEKGPGLMWRGPPMPTHPACGRVDGLRWGTWGG